MDDALGSDQKKERSARGKKRDLLIHLNAGGNAPMQGRKDFQVKKKISRRGRKRHLRKLVAKKKRKRNDVVGRLQLSKKKKI